MRGLVLTLLNPVFNCTTISQKAPFLSATAPVIVAYNAAQRTVIFFPIQGAVIICCGMPAAAHCSPPDLLKSFCFYQPQGMGTLTGNN